MPDKLHELYDEWKKTIPDNPDDFAVFQGGFTLSAIAMRARAQKLAQTLTGNDLINAIGSLPDIPE